MMRLLERFFTAFREDLIHFASVIGDAVHGRWNGSDVVIPDPVVQVEAPVARSSKADLSAEQILAFLKTQGKKSTVFDGYVAAEKRREVSTDE